MSAATLRKVEIGNRMAMKNHPRRAEIFWELAVHRSRFIGSLSNDNEFTLADLTSGTGQLAGVIIGNFSPTAGKIIVTDVLKRIAAHCIGWLDTLRVDAFEMIHAERERQKELFSRGKFLFTCDSAIADPKRKLRVLVEEIGEVAKALEKLELTNGRSHARIARFDARQNLIEEIVQVAAVVIAWLETPQVKP